MGQVAQKWGGGLKPELVPVMVQLENCYFTNETLATLAACCFHVEDTRQRVHHITTNPQPHRHSAQHSHGLHHTRQSLVRSGHCWSQGQTELELKRVSIRSAVRATISPHIPQNSSELLGVCLQTVLHFHTDRSLCGMENQDSAIHLTERFSGQC